jgi:hypothetical protein
MSAKRSEDSFEQVAIVELALEKSRARTEGKPPDSASSSASPLASSSS